jgi:adenylyltransferase/sulfurtransferase
MAVDAGGDRFLRQRALLGFGRPGQERLADARIAVIGAGGLGNAVLPVLAGAGVGSIAIIDDDTVDIANLHRQTLYTAADAGRGKAEAAAEALRRIAPDAAITPLALRFAPETAALLDDVDLVVDGSDALATRYLADDAAAERGIPLVWGSALGWAGQVGVAWERYGIGYRDLYPLSADEPADDLAGDTCSTVGVLPSVCTVIGGLMASEALKLLTGSGDPLLGRAIVYDARRGDLREIAYRREGEPVRRMPAAPVVHETVSPAELAALLGTPAGAPVLLDVREDDEVARVALPGARHIPLGDLERRVGELDPDAATVVYCHLGVRSAHALDVLAAAGFQNARHLAGGIDAYAAQVDPALARY